jgi:PKD repeat protein
VSFAISAPTINTSIVHSPEPVVVSSTVLFTATASTDGTPLSYVWNFGDGSTASGLTASHVYTHDGSYTAIFTATDACNFTRVQTSTVTVNAPTINANFNQSATSLVVSNSVNFTDTSTTNLPPIAAWDWDFGDGTPHVFTQNASHAFMTLGVRTVRLTVTDTLGYSAFHTSTVTVNAPTINANFTQSATSVVVNSTVRFTDTSSTNGPPIVGWGWNFGDGSLSTLQHPTHLYTTIGSYTVTLLITDSLGYTATHSVINAVSVQQACTSLTNVAFTYTPVKPLVHTSVAFTATIVPIGATPPITYVWNFGDSSVVTNTVPMIQHTYHVTGTQIATVTAYNACTPLGVSAQNAITIEPYRVFLPLAAKN